MMIEAMSHLGIRMVIAFLNSIERSLGEMADVVNSGCSGTPKIFDRHGRDLAVNVPRIW